MAASPPKGDENMANHQTRGQGCTPKVICQKCGTQVDSTSSSTLQTDRAVDGSSTSSSNHLTDELTSASETSSEEEISTKTAIEEAEVPKRSRIGRFVKTRNGNERIVDYDDPEGTHPDFPGGGDFVIAIKSEFSWNRPELDRPEESIVLISPSLARAYHSVMKDFGGTRLGRLGRRTANIPEPYSPLFFYWENICNAVVKPEFACEDDFQVLAQFYSKRIQPDHDRIKASLDEREVVYHDLWALFRPGELIYCLDECGEPSLQILIQTEYRDNDRSRQYKRIVADTWRISWDHSTGLFNREVITQAIRAFAGSRPITSLPFYPVKYYGDQSPQKIDELRSRLQARGHIWRKLVSQSPQCLKYSGPARKYCSSEDEYVSHH